VVSTAAYDAGADSTAQPAGGRLWGRTALGARSEGGRKSRDARKGDTPVAASDADDVLPRRSQRRRKRMKMG